MARSRARVPSQRTLPGKTTAYSGTGDIFAVSSTRNLVYAIMEGWMNAFVRLGKPRWNEGWGSKGSVRACLR